MRIIRVPVLWAIGLLAGMALVIVLLPGPSAAAVPNDTITLTSPNNVTLQEGEDYATQVLHNPADMSGLDDLRYPYHLTWPTVNNGIWQATSIAGDAIVFLQFHGFPGTYSWVGQPDGVNYPIDTTRFTHLRLRMNLSQGGNAVIWWWAAHGGLPFGNSQFTNYQPGWHIYDIDLAAGSNWTSQPAAGVRLDLPPNTPGNNVQIDWARISKATNTAVQINWTYSSGGNPTVNLYLSTDPNANGADEMLIASVPAGNRTYSWTGAGMAPGTYYIHAAMNGARAASGPLVIAPRPIVHVDAPSPLSGEDFAAARIATQWDEYNPGQFPVTYNVGPISYNPSYLQTSATNNDPQVWWLAYDQAHAIDTSRYRYMNVKLWIAHPPSNSANWENAGPRMTWSVPINLNWQQSQGSSAPYDQWLPITIDMPNVPLAGGTTGWHGQVTTLRFDPHEEDDSGAIPPFFRIDKAHLTAQPQSNGATLIRWTPLQGAGMVDLYYDTDNVGFNGTAIIGALPLSAGSYGWNTASLPNGASYYIFIVTHDPSGAVADIQYSLAPVVINHGAPSSIFSDVPTNNPFANYINNIATRGIVSGYGQSDSTVLFRAGLATTRGQISKMIVLARNWPITTTGGPHFVDVPAGSTYYPYVETAYARGAISGYSDHTFRPGLNVTRGQTAKMLVTAWGWAINGAGGPHFNDVPSSNPFYGYVETVYNRGVISGYSDRTFRAGLDVTRGQLAKMLSNALAAP